MSGDGAGQAGAPARLLARRLRRLRGLAFLVLAFERVWPALWPALGSAGVFLAAALLGLTALLSPLVHDGVLLGALALVCVALWRGIGRLRLPDAAALDRRIEHASGLAHRPLAVLADQPAAPDAAALALWRAHRGQILAGLARMRAGWPHPGLAARDRRALRGGLVVLLVAAGAIAGGRGPARVAAALTPILPPARPVLAPKVAAWITPPAYTGLAPVMLDPAHPDVAVPAGAVLAVSVTGGRGAPALSLGGHSILFREIAPGSFHAGARLVSGGRLLLARGARRLGRWSLSVIADAPPRVAFTAPPTITPGGSLRLPWTAADDYGVVALAARLRLVVRPRARPAEVAIPLPGGAPRQASGVAVADLKASRFAGLRVTLRLEARDAPGQFGRSRAVTLRLPERTFHNPLARALIAVRKRLVRDPAERAIPSTQLDTLAADPAGFKDDAGIYLTLTATASLLRVDRRPQAAREAAGRLWRLALALERGPLARTAAALKRAERALAKAMAAKPPDPKEIARLTKALEKALKRQLQALAQEAARRHASLPMDPRAQRLAASDLARLAQRMRRDLAAGRMAAAQRDFAKLQALLHQLARARLAPPLSKAQQAVARKAQRQMAALQDLVQREAGLIDRAQRRAAGMMFAPGPAAVQRAQDQAVQRALRRAVADLAKRFGALAGKVPPGLPAAHGAMGRAARALGRGQDEAAAEAEKQALAALQKGGQGMAQAMAGKLGAGGRSLIGQGGTGPAGQGGRSPGQDPLGRQRGANGRGMDESNSVRIPTRLERTRIRAIARDLRRRSADPGLSPAERAYIERLLKPF